MIAGVVVIVGVGNDGRRQELAKGLRPGNHVRACRNLRRRRPLSIVAQALRWWSMILAPFPFGAV